MQIATLKLVLYRSKTVNIKTASAVHLYFIVKLKTRRPLSEPGPLLIHTNHALGPCVGANSKYRVYHFGVGRNPKVHDKHLFVILRQLKKTGLSFTGQLFRLPTTKQKTATHKSLNFVYKLSSWGRLGIEMRLSWDLKLKVIFIYVKLITWPTPLLY